MLPKPICNRCDEYRPIPKNAAWRIRRDTNVPTKIGRYRFLASFRPATTATDIFTENKHCFLRKRRYFYGVIIDSFGLSQSALPREKTFSTDVGFGFRLLKPQRTHPLTKTRKNRGVDRTVEKMLRRMGQPSAPRSDASSPSSTAAEAIVNIAEIQKRIARGDNDAAQFYIKRLAASKAAAGDETGSRGSGRFEPATTPGDFRLSRRLVTSTAIGFFAIVAAIAAGTAAIWLLSPTHHSVAGIVLLDQNSAADVELIFHSTSASNRRVQIKTGGEGQFELEALPAGNYKIVILPGKSNHEIPKHYMSAVSTPLRLKLHEDTENLTMAVATK